MTKNGISRFETVLKEFGLTNLRIVVFNRRFLKKYEIAMLCRPDEHFFGIYLKNQKNLTF